MKSIGRESLSPEEGKEMGLYNATIVPLVFSKGKLLEINGKELRFLEAWMRLNDVEKACKEVDFTQEEAEKAINRPKNREYLEDRMKEIAISKGLTADWFLSSLYEVWEGKKQVSREQMEAIKEIGRRAAPSTESSKDGKVVINVNVGALEEAINRKQAIEASIVKEMPT